LVANRSDRFRGLNIYSALSILFGAIAVLVLVANTVTTSPPYVVGENLVSVEIHILPNLYMKPITLFVYTFFLSFCFGLNSPATRNRFIRTRDGIRKSLSIIGWLITMASGFEILYHIVIWSAALAVQGLQNPDIIVNPWPESVFPINVVFSAKIVVLIFASSCFFVSYLGSIDREKNTSEFVRVLEKIVHPIEATNLKFRQSFEVDASSKRGDEDQYEEVGNV